MRTVAAAALAVLSSAAYLVVLATSAGSVELAVSNLGQLLASALASAGCLLAARHREGPRRTAWWCLGAGTGSWALGQVVWTYYELVLGRSTPFPSLADVGFLLFPVLAASGLVIFLGNQAHQLAARGRDVFDGAIIAVALLLLSWMTTLGAVVAARDDSWFALALSLAYPVGDVVVATLVLIALVRSRGPDRGMLLLAVGLGGLAFSDSAYVYLVSNASFTSGSLVTTGWVVGFLFVGVAGVAAVDQPSVEVLSPGTTMVSRPSALRAALPFIPVVAAGTAVFIHLLTSLAPSAVDVVIGATLVAMVLVRQYLAAVDNQRLLVALGEARDELHHRATHDDLTGLANRALFSERLDGALAPQDADVAVLYCDLDDFKSVNDEHGHAVGDAYLVEVARRMTACVRSTDTVARIGGDEFVILLRDNSQPDAVADRVVRSVGAITHVEGHHVRAAVSVGLDRHRAVPEGGWDAQARTSAATALMGSADAAMYAAKLAGRNRVMTVSHS